MKQFRTHYDNLKVARDAPDIVIRAAYKSLSQRFHPDKNPGDEHAAHVMAIINQSYEVLCDPSRRKAHDDWINQMEAELAKEKIAGNRREENFNQRFSSRKQKPFFILIASLSSIIKRLIVFTFSYAIGIGTVIGAIALIGFAFDNLGDKKTPPPGPKPYTAVPPAESKPAYSRPESAPNGSRWPLSADYVDGYLINATDGFSEITVDNGQNNSDVFVKLVSLDNAQAFPVRHFFIPSGSRFTLKNVAAGSYDIRYRDLDTGGLSRSEAFQVEQIQTENGFQYSTIDITLYKTQDGNFQTYSLSESEF